MARVSAMRIITAKTTDFAVPKLKASVIQCCATCLVDIIDCACSCPPTYACARAVCLYIRYSTKTFIVDQTDTRLHGFVSCVHVHCPLVSCINTSSRRSHPIYLSIIHIIILLSQPVKTFLSEYGRNASSNFAQVLDNSRDGVFAASCFLHCHFTLDRPLINGTNVVDALYLWALQYMRKSDGAHMSYTGDFNWIDRCPNDQYWPPCNKHCPLLPN